MKWSGPVFDGEECAHCTQEAPCTELHREAWTALPTIRGPKSMCTEERKVAFLVAIEKGASPKMACQIVGWSQEVFVKWKREVREGVAPAHLVKFIEEDIPEARTKLLLRALDAIGDGLDQEDDDKRAHLGLKVMEKFYGSELNLAPVKHTGADGSSPVEFRVVFDTPALPPKRIESVQDILAEGVPVNEEDKDE